MPAGSVRRPDQGAIDQNHEERIRALERSPGSGIRFNVDNEGGWLEIVTNDFASLLGSDRGIAIWDATGEGFLIGSGNPAGTGSSIELTQALPIRIEGLAGTDILLPEEGTSFRIVATDTGDILFEVDEDGNVTAGGVAIGTVSDVTSTDSSIDVTNPTGPTTDLAVAVVDGGSP